MAQLKVTGDVIQIKSNITNKMFEKAKAYKPEALELRDEEGAPTFVVTTGTPSQSKFGIAFCNSDANGKLFMTYENPCHDHSDLEAERQIIKEAYAVILANLRRVEEQVNAATAELNTLEREVEDAIDFTDMCDCDNAQVSLSDCIAD